MELHWLPIQQRVYFKLAVLTYNTRHTKEPDYLFDLVKFYEPIRTLRSTSRGLLSRTRTCTVIASPAFKHSSVFVWNSLPTDIYNCDSLLAFRRLLKSFYLTLHSPLSHRDILPTPTNSLTRNKSNDYFESMQYRQDRFIITHYHKRKHFPNYTCCSENHNNTSAKIAKIRGLNLILCSSAIWR